VGLSGKGIAVSSLTLSATNLTFDSTKVGGTTRKTLTVTNGGTGNITVSGITIGGTDAALFKVTPTQFTLAAKGTKAITISFAPTSAGNKSASLSIAHSGGNSPAVVGLSGRGYQPQPEGLQVTVGAGTGNPGSSVTVSVSVNTAKGIAGGDLTLTYDSKLLAAKEVKAGDLLTSAGIAVIPNLTTPGQVKVAMAGATGISSGSGPLLQITFDVLAAVAPGTYELGLDAMLWDENGLSLPAAVVKGSVTVKAKSGKLAGEGVPVSGLMPSYPNPFNSTTIIPFQVAAAGHVRLAAYNLVGQQVRVLVDETREAGSYEALWDGRDEEGREAGTGIYLCEFRIGEYRATMGIASLR
jgi:hypothetical protein